MEAGDQRRRVVLLYAALFAAALAVHLPSVAVPFQFDDFHHIAENPSVMRLSNVPDYFVDPQHFSSKVGVGMYRPLLMTTHALNYAWTGSGAWSYHLVNILLHLANAALVLSLFRRWMRSDGTAFFFALLWAVAAVQHETVAYLSARSSLLASFFMLLAMRITDKRETGWKTGAGASALFILGLMSKEIAFVLPLLVLLRDGTLGRGRGFRLKDRLALYIPLFALMPAYLVARARLFGSVLGEKVIPVHMYGLTQFKVYFYYLLKTLFPANLTLMPGFHLTADPVAPSVVLCMSAFLALMAAATVSIRRRPAFAFGVLWFTVCLVPTSSIVPLWLIASIERVYPALVGLLVPVAAAAKQVAGRRARPLVLAAAAVIALNAAITVDRHLAWCSQMGLMREMVKGAPDKSNSWSWLGLMEFKAGMIERARDHLLKSLLINPNDSVAHETLGKLYLSQGEGATAREQLMQIAGNPALPEAKRASALLNLALLEVKEGDGEGADRYLEKALAMDPENSEAFMLLGKVAEIRGELEDAETYYLRALNIYPDFPEVLTQLGIVMFKTGRLKEARRYLEQVAQRGPDWPEVYSNLGLISFQEGKMEESERWFERSVEADPGHAVGYYGLGGIRAGKGDLQAARGYFETAVEKNPEFAEARLLLSRVLMDLARSPGASPNEKGDLLQAAAEHIRWLRQKGRPEAGELVKQWQGMTGRELE